MRKIVVALAAVVALAVAAAPAHAIDKDCSDFGSWKEAQHYGIACEDLR